MQNFEHTIRATVWRYTGKAAWHFLTIPKQEADEIKREYLAPRRGFGSIPITVTIGKTTWKTSIFPDKNGTYLLPLKKEVRVKEKIKEGNIITVSIEVTT